VNRAELAETLGSRLGERLEEVDAPGAAAALVDREGVVWQGSTGVARPASGSPASVETAFLWFSMTKIATATATMQLVDAGALGLDSPARELLPELEALDPRITTRQLLNHSSGIGNPPPLRWIHPVDQPAPDSRELVERLLRRHGKPKFRPGSRSAYSNIGYLVLGELIAAASGLPYRRYVADRLLEPLGARSTGFDFEAAGRSNASEGAHPRRDLALPLLRLLIPRWALDGTAGRWRLFNPFLLDGSAYGGLVGPAGDAALLAAAHLGGGEVNGRRILTPESAAEMQRISIAGKKFDLGLGWFRRHRDSLRGLAHVEHLGGGGGYGTVMRLYPDRGLGVVAMANVSSQRFQHEKLLEPLALGAPGGPSAGTVRAVES
jgi:CubicO group peptidase (beta-lactamase class C family)